MVAVSKHQYQHDRVMRLKSSRSSGGKHRTITTSRTKGRLALVAVAAGTVSSAGVGGATAATLQAPAEVEAPVSPEAATVEVDLATNDTALSSSGTQAAPQILAISEFKPVANIDEQLDKAIQYNAERAQNERAARAPSAVKPAEGTFTSGSGVRWGTLHAGIDIANVVGTPILAAMGGTVIDSGPASGFGQWIRIQHDDGSIAVYGHMETLDVTVGERVTAGQRITGMGNRGFPPALTCTSSFTRLAAGRSTRCPGSPSTASPSNLPALTRTGPDTGTGGSDWAGGTRLRPQRRFSFIADTART